MLKPPNVGDTVYLIYHYPYVPLSDRHLIRCTVTAVSSAGSVKLKSDGDTGRGHVRRDWYKPEEFLPDFESAKTALIAARIQKVAHQERELREAQSMLAGAKVLRETDL